MNNSSLWRDYWLKLPDSVFFDSMKLFPLPLPSNAPYNKHKMIDALISFFLKAETQNAVLESLTEDDKRLLSAVAFFGNLNPSKIYFFFREEETQERFFFRLLNLEERLLIFRHPQEEILLINPILEARLKESVISPFYFFSQSPETATPESPIPWISDSLLLTIVAYLNANPKSLRSNGELRKKAHETLSQLIHTHSDDDPSPEVQIRLILKFLKDIEVLKPTEDGLLFLTKEFLKLQECLLPDLMILIIAADQRLPESLSLGEKASLLRSLLNEIKRLGSCNDRDFTNLFYIFSHCHPQTEHIVPLFKTVLFESRLIVSSINRVFVNPLINFQTENEKTSHAIIYEDGQILYSPWGNPKSSFYLPLFTDIIDFNLYPIFKISQNSLFRAFDLSITPQEIIELINQLSDHPLSEGLKKRIESAYNIYNEVGIWKGIVIQLPPIKASAASKHSLLKQWIVAHPSENVFVFDEAHFQEVEKELKSLGIAHIPQLPNYCEPPTLSATKKLSVSEFSLPFDISCAPLLQESSSKEKEREEFLQAKLQEKKYHETLAEELSAKIRKKMILFPEQIQLHAQRKDTLTASGLDFTHKLNLIKSALKDSTYILEIRFFKEGKKIHHLAQPKELKRLENQHTLLYTTPGREEILSVEAEKLSSVKLIRSSLWLY